ncbi:non-ribosomal peptide synthetase [Aquimarina muelleri]|uniref:non-ribosomal peptide synthetase n=1 Tax=Aquimarina muelleri TaxID=279356 RepID=UPI003F6875A8
MKEILNKILAGGLIVNVKDGELQIFSTKDKVSEDLISEIKSKKNELVSYLLKHKESSLQNKKYQKIPKCDEKDSYPVSNSQLRLWLASQTEESSIAYNMPNSIILDGTYDIEYFQKAIHSVIERHEILRTVFKLNEEGEVRQHVLSSKELDFEIIFKDFSEEKNQKFTWQEYVKSDSHKPFNLENGPLLRAGLLKLTKDQFIFYYNIHHIISDEWSMKVLVHDVIKFYEAHLSRIPSDLLPLNINYKDYTIWQLEEQNKSTFQEHKNYWISQFTEEVEVIDLPLKKKRPTNRSYNGKSISTELSVEETSKLKSFTKEREGSLFSGLFAAWNVLLYRYTGLTDLTIGNPVGGRDHPDLENQIGYYLHTLALRNKIDPESTFEKLYDKVKINILEAYKHQTYPFDKLIEDLSIKRDIGRNPLFDILVDYHGISETSKSFKEDTEIQDLGSGVVKFDLELHLTEADERVNIMINYNQDIYDQEMIECLIIHYKRLIKALIEESGKSINKVNFLTREEEQQLVNKFNDTQNLNSFKNKTVIDLFVKKAKEIPNAIAVVFEDTAITYKELEEKSNQFANCLLDEYKIQKGDYIGVHLDKSEQYIISIFGILKAGCVYVPIDTNYPKERKKYIVENAKISLLLSDTSYMLDTDYYDGALLAIDVNFDPTLYSKENTFFGLSNNLAYVIYTSGSTGNPKGVMIEHHSLVNYIKWCSENYLEENFRNQNFGLFTSPSFDLTITSIFLPLVNGSTLKVFNENSNVSELLKEYLTSDISCIKITPSHISLLKELKIKDSNLEMVIVGGEELKENHVKILQQINPNIKIYNEYGPTEATVGCVVCEIKKSEEPIHIGKPIDNTSIYILDNSRQLVPLGVVGEIYIGGEGVARGYLNQSQLTKEKFVNNPFNKEEILYKTGDIGCWLPNGTINFIGRKDNQVKIRGYRIELEEIESALNQLESIEESVVLVKKDNYDFEQLVAYVIFAKETDVRFLQKELEKKLPEYMVPKIYVPIDKMPLTHNGKINRKILPTPKDSAYNQKKIIEPSSDTETKLVLLWQEILELDTVSVLDDFFELGGHSLLAVKLSFAITKTCNVKFDISTIFKHPTLQSQAQFIDIITINSDKKESIDEEVLHI